MVLAFAVHVTADPVFALRPIICVALVVALVLAVMPPILLELLVQLSEEKL